MSSLVFWRNWSRSYRLTYLLSLSILLISLLVFLAVWWRGLGNVVHWNVLSELIDLPITLQTFTDGLLDYPIPGKAYAVSEQFVASRMNVYPAMATALALGLSAAFALLLSAVSALKRVAYLGAMTVFVLAMALFRFELLEPSGLKGRYLFISLTFGVGALSYYFHAFRPDIRLPVRLGSFAVLLAVEAFVVTTLARVSFPALTLVSYGLPILLILSVGFIFFIATEIIAVLVWLTSTNRTGGQPLGLKNLMVISGLYLINLALIYLKNTKSLDWDVLVISPFIIYLISVSLGIWGFRQLTDQRGQEPFQDAGAYLYVGLALLSTLTISYAFATANDPLIEVFEDAITYSHFVMGVLFVVYVLINYLPLYRQHLPVYRVLYKPRTFQFPLVRLLGIIGILFLLYGQKFFTIRQAVAGYYNGLGDLYTTTGETASANAFYQLALEQEFQNHKSNYALASLALNQGDLTSAAGFFQQALQKQPSPQAYAGLSSVYLQNNLFFEAVKALQRGIRAFPKNGELQNNLGFLYARTHVADSAYYYFQSAAGLAARPVVPEANLLAFWARNPRLLATTSQPVSQPAERDYEAYQANALALRLVTGADTTVPGRPAWLAKDSGEGLSVGRFASLYNYTLVNQKPDTSLLTTLQRQSLDPVNQDFTDDLLLARVVASYRSHQPADAFALLSQLAEGDNRNGPAYRTMTGLWLMELGLYPKAAQTFELNTDSLSTYYRALAMTKAAAVHAGDLVAAYSTWALAARNDPTVARLKQVLYGEKKPENDLEKAFYVVYHPDEANRGTLWETIRDPNLRTVAGASLISSFLATKQVFYAQMILSQMAPPKKLNAFALSIENLSTLRITVAKKNLKATLALANQFFLPQHRAERALLLAQAYTSGHQPAQAQRAYRQALQLAPLDASLVTGAAQFEQQQGHSKPAYQLVLNALPFNEDNPALLRLYTLLCLDLSLSDYAREGLAHLQRVVPTTDYQAFLATYQEKRALLEKQRQKFLE